MDNLNIPTIFTDEAWQQCLEDYLRHMFFGKSKSAKTLHIYKAFLQEFFSSSANGGPRSPENYTRRDVLAFVNRPSKSLYHPGEELAEGTKRLRLTVLKSFYKWCVDYTVSGPDGKPQRLLQVTPPTAGVDYARRTYTYKAMTLEEIHAFFNAIDQSTIGGARDFCIYTFYLYTLRRREEIARLTWGDVFRGTIRDEHGHTHEGWLYQWTGKGDAGQLHIIELPGPCVDALTRWLEVSGRDGAIRPEDALFTPVGYGRNGAKPYNGTRQPLGATTIAYNFKRYCAKAGIDPQKYSIHSFRHSGIQQRILSGQEITDIMNVSSHKSLDSFIIYARKLSTADTGVSALEQRLNLGVK